MSLRLNRSKKPFHLMRSQRNSNFKAKLLDTVLKVRKVHISSSAYLGITIALKEDTAKYPVRHVVIKSCSISADSM